MKGTHFTAKKVQEKYPKLSLESSEKVAIQLSRALEYFARFDFQKAKELIRLFDEENISLWDMKRTFNLRISQKILRESGNCEYRDMPGYNCG